jgi:hypothetical protein
MNHTDRRKDSVYSLWFTSRSLCKECKYKQGNKLNIVGDTTRLWTAPSCTAAVCRYVSRGIDFSLASPFRARQQGKFVYIRAQVNEEHTSGCWIRGSHGGDYEKYHLMGRGAIQSGPNWSTFLWNLYCTRLHGVTSQKIFFTHDLRFSQRWL